jgi:hypothetical protein
MKTPLLVLIFGALAASVATPVEDYRLFPNGINVHSETILSGIDVRSDTPKQVIKKLGEPARVTVLRRIEEAGILVTVRAYEWQTKTCRLRLIASQANEREPRSESIDVWGTRPEAEIGITGHGLKLGDVIRDARRIYQIAHVLWSRSPRRPYVLGGFSGLRWAESDDRL